MDGLGEGCHCEEEGGGGVRLTQNLEKRKKETESRTKDDAYCIDQDKEQVTPNNEHQVNQDNDEQDNNNSLVWCADTTQDVYDSKQEKQDND